MLKEELERACPYEPGDAIEYFESVAGRNFLSDVSALMKIYYRKPVMRQKIKEILPEQLTLKTLDTKKNILTVLFKGRKIKIEKTWKDIQWACVQEGNNE